MNCTNHRTGRAGRAAARRLTGALTAALLAAGAAAQHDGDVPTLPVRTHDWADATVEAMATLPVQYGGRMMPFGTYAAFTLYAVHGRRDLKLDLDGDKKSDVTLTPTEWLLDVWFFPDRARDYPLFRIENVGVLDAIHIANQGQRFTFDYVSHRQLLTPDAEGKSPGQRLLELRERYRGMKSGARSPVEQHIVETGNNLLTYHSLAQQLDVLPMQLPVEGAQLREVFGGKEKIDLADVVADGTGLTRLIRDHRDNTEAAPLGNAMSIAAVLAEIVQSADHAGSGPALFPPTGSAADAEEWLQVPQLVDAALFGRSGREQAVMVGHLRAALVAEDHAERQRELVAFRDVVVARAEARGEYGKIALESYYYEASWHYRALHWFLLAILVVGIGWTAPRKKLLWWAGIALTAVPLAFLTTDIVLRSIIRERPPILNLYDTFLFIAAVGVLAGIVAELVSRRRVALSLSPVFGALLIMLARWFEVGDGKDQLAPPQAVLDTNYYLATHVTTINMGYAAGLFAAFLGTTWLLFGAFGFRRGDTTFHKSIVRATYGVTAFGLVFAVFGTIYGGVWANDSWGRFWGWDPKENGALLICLAQVALLHARMVGWVRDLGFCICAGLIGIVVVFSWFHVNLLEIGLHSYGFASSTKTALVTYYWVQGALVAVGAAGVLIRRAAKVPAEALAGQAPGA